MSWVLKISQCHKHKQKQKDIVGLTKRKKEKRGNSQVFALVILNRNHFYIILSCWVRWQQAVPKNESPFNQAA